MKSLEDNHVFDLATVPAGHKVVGSKWVFKKKKVWWIKQD